MASDGNREGCHLSAAMYIAMRKTWTVGDRGGTIALDIFPDHLPAPALERDADYCTEGGVRHHSLATWYVLYRHGLWVYDSVLRTLTS
jgi:hypothetical protein